MKLGDLTYDAWFNATAARDAYKAKDYSLARQYLRVLRDELDRELPRPKEADKLPLDKSGEVDV